MSRTLKIAFWATVIGQIILLLAFIAVKEDTLRSGTSVMPVASLMVVVAPEAQAKATNGSTSWA